MQTNTCLWMVAAFPPPVHGQSVANLQLARRFEFGIKLLDIGPGPARNKIQYHLARIFRVIRAVASMTMMRDGSARNVAYFVYESGLGAIYNWMLVATAKVLGYRLYMHHHTAQHVLNRSSRAAALLRFAGTECVHITLSDVMRRDFASAYPGAMVLKMENAIFIEDRSSGITRLPSVPFTIGTLSNLSQSKGTPAVIESFLELQRLGFAVRLLVAGPIKDEVTKKKIGEAVALFPRSIQYLGAVDGFKKAQFYDELDVFLFPSEYRYEAQPLVVLEAMEAGVPCLVKPAGYTAELVGDAGLVCNGPDFVEWAVSQMVELMNSADLLATMRNRARTRFLALAQQGNSDFQRLELSLNCNAAT